MGKIRIRRKTRKLVFPAQVGFINQPRKYCYVLENYMSCSTRNYLQIFGKDGASQFQEKSICWEVKNIPEVELLMCKFIYALTWRQLLITSIKVRLHKGLRFTSLID